MESQGQDSQDFSKDAHFRIVSEATVYSRYLCVIDRQVEFPNGKIIKWDIVGHQFNKDCVFVCSFPFDTKTKTTTLIKEWCQATNRLTFGLPCGHYDSKHHTSYQHAAECELSEEAQLKDAKWVKLLPEEKKEGIMEVKWCKNHFFPFLALDPIVDTTPLPRDQEEYINIYHNVSIDKVKEIIMSGEMQLHSVTTSFMALQYLEKNGML